MCFLGAFENHVRQGRYQIGIRDDIGKASNDSQIITGVGAISPIAKADPAFRI
jgi:hypothetical protein